MKTNDSAELTAEEEKILNRIPLEILLLASAGAVMAGFFLDIPAALFVLGGGVFAAGSFIWLKKTLSRLLGGEKNKKALRIILSSYLPRLLLIIGIFSIIIIFFSKLIFAFMAGFSAIVVVLFVEAVAGISKMTKWKN